MSDRWQRSGLWHALVAALILAMQPGLAQQQDAESSAEKPTASVAAVTTGELMYHILLAELAARRGEFTVALDNYRVAARVSDDPRVAERAANMAVFIKDNDATMALAERWLALDSDNIRARQAMALALLRNGEVEAAMAHVEAVRESAAGDEQQDGFGTVAALLNQVTDKAAVLDVFARLKASHPESRFAHYYHALAAMRQEQADAALASLDRALQLQPNWREALLLRTQIRVQQAEGEAEAAFEELAQAVAAAPEDRELRIGYARLLVSADKLQQAREQFETLAEQNPEDADSLYALGLLAAESEQLDIAEDYLMRVLDLGQRPLDVYFELGKLEEQRDNFAEARKWYEQVDDGDRYLSAQVRAATMLARGGDLDAMRSRMVELRARNPDDAVALHISEAEVLRENKLNQEAFDSLSDALKQFPDDKDLLYARALAAEKVDRIDVLEQDLRSILAEEPNNGHALNALGYTLADRTERYDEALGLLLRAVELLPEDAAVLDSMGWVKYRLGAYDESLGFLRRAYELNDDAEIVSHLSEVLWVSGAKDEARQLWRKAFEADPESEHLQKLNERFSLDQ